VANGADASADGNPAGVWELKIDVNARTSICCINLPFFDRENPVQNTKPARVRISRTQFCTPSLSLTALRSMRVRSRRSRSRNFSPACTTT